MYVNFWLIFSANFYYIKIPLVSVSPTFYKKKKKNGETKIAKGPNDDVEPTPRNHYIFQPTTCLPGGIKYCVTQLKEMRKQNKSSLYNATDLITTRASILLLVKDFFIQNVFKPGEHTKFRKVERTLIFLVYLKTINSIRLRE